MHAYINAFDKTVGWSRARARAPKKQKAYSTWYSQAVTHPSTNQAPRCLNSVIRREPVYSA